MYGNISADTDAMRLQNAKLDTVISDIEETSLGLEQQLNKLCGMGLGVAEDQFRLDIMLLRRIKDELAQHRDSLDKIIRIYDETEAEQIRRVEKLADNVDGMLKSNFVIAIRECIYDAIPPMTFFSGRSLKNDDWLAGLVNEWRDNENEQI